uniref:Uncharacterized protein n=1 Tax=Zonotrichia albicollis TaxID=44394 RepID=A0A8D2M3S2_ZONAL
MGSWLLTSTPRSFSASQFPSHSSPFGLKSLYLHIMYKMVFLLGFPGSFIVISIIIRLNLALTDLYLTGLPFLMHYCATGEQSIFGEFMHKFTCFSFFFKLCCSIPFLTCFSAFMVMFDTMKFFHILRKSSCLNLTSSANLGTIRWLLTSLAFFLPLLIVALLAVVLLVVFHVYFLPFHIFWGLSCPTALKTYGNILLYIVVGDNFQQAMLSPSRSKWSKYIQEQKLHDQVSLKLWSPLK